ncbi:transmembrane protein, putative [Medicago truncatula]|uniref:Transmembrane protein, putative n=1 Tax=Medicago truncatula TaxID=3880 RepID=G7JAI6_MEDTR|nr:transmembrane protein, putative [Medicago truncatula]
MNQNSNSTESYKVISKLLLPEDLLLCIFILVPLNFLYNSDLYAKLGLQLLEALILLNSRRKSIFTLKTANHEEVLISWNSKMI